MPNPEVALVREHFAELINDALADAGSDTRVTHESYAARGIPFEGTQHLGPKANAMERAGQATERGDINREIMEARIAWQAEIEPQITEDVQRSLESRFGDGFDASLARVREAEAVPAFEEQVTQDVRPFENDLHDSAKADFPTQPRGWAERMRQFYDHAIENAVALFQDEGSGGKPQPDAARETTPPDAEAATISARDEALPQSPQEPARRGVMSWVRHLFHRDGSPEPGGDPARPGANAQAPAPDAAEPQAGADTPAAEPSAAAGGTAAPPGATQPAAPVEPPADWTGYAALPDAPPTPERPQWRDYAERQNPPASPQANKPQSPEPDIDLDL
jgi:hypothetical protein